MDDPRTVWARMMDELLEATIEAAYEDIAELAYEAWLIEEWPEAS